jgi:RNA polymerase sigma factor (sigma-70 family)
MADEWSQMTSSSLFEKYRVSQSEDAFAEIVSRHGSLVYRTALRITKQTEEAEDVMQAVFLVLARAKPPREALPVWLHGVTRRIACRAVRDRMRLAARETRAAEERKGGDGLDRRNDLKEELDAGIASLPRQQREILILRYLEGRQTEEAAQRAGVSLRTAERLTAAGLAHLRTFFSSRGLVLEDMALAAALLAEHQNAIPEAAAQKALRAASGAVSSKVATLAQAELSAHTVSLGAVVLALSAVLVTGAVFVSIHKASSPNAQNLPVAATPVAAAPLPYQLDCTRGLAGWTVADMLQESNVKSGTDGRRAIRLTPEFKKPRGYARLPLQGLPSGMVLEYEIEIDSVIDKTQRVSFSVGFNLMPDPACIKIVDEAKSPDRLVKDKLYRMRVESRPLDGKAARKETLYIDGVAVKTIENSADPDGLLLEVENAVVDVLALRATRE